MKGFLALAANRIAAIDTAALRAGEIFNRLIRQSCFEA